MIVELYGLPGAGKTTFAKRMVDHHGYTVIKARSVGELLSLNAKFLFRNPLRAISLLYYILRFGSKNFRRNFTNLFLHHNAKYEKARSYRKAIIDQGHFQNVISLFETEAGSDVVSKYVKHFSKATVLLLFDPSVEVLDSRVKGRGYFARNDTSKNDFAHWSHVLQKNHRTLMTLMGSTNTQAVVIKSETDVKNIEEKLSTNDILEIVYVTNVRFPSEKAHGFQIAKTCEAFGRLGSLLTLVVPKRKNSILEDAFSYYGVENNFKILYRRVPDFLQYSQLLGKMAYYLQSLFFFTSVLRLKIRGCVVYYTRSSEIAWLLKIRGANTVLCEAHFWPKRRQRLNAFFLKKADLVVCNSQGTESVCKKFGVRKTLVAPNGVDLEQFTLHKKDDELRTRYSLPKDKKIVLYSGSFQSWKGVDTALQAWSHFQHANGPLLVLVGGEKMDLNQEDSQRVSQMKNVLILGRKSPREIPELLSLADVLLLPNSPSSEESVLFTSPIKMFEYMASGRPIVSSDLPSIREVLNDDNALFFEAGNETDLAKKISTLLEEPNRGQKLGSRALEDVAQYTWSKRAEKIWNTIQ